jgi:ABC-2 type transport system ATP-binding protein
MTTPWLQIDNLRLDRGSRPVLQGVNTALSGKAIGLVGANGAGKSTLIGAILGVLKFHSGSISILDMQIPRDARHLRTRAGVMAEQAGIFPGGSGVDAVSFAGMMSGLKKRESLRRAHRVLDALDVGEERYRPTKGYSTGMRQRCKLAMSLVHDPELLILDEPTVGLDPAGRAQLLSLIRDLKQEGRNILLSTHILQDAEYVCDDLLLLESGVVSFSGSVGELLGGESGRISVTLGKWEESFLAAIAGAGIQVERESDLRFSILSSGDSDLKRFWSLAHEYGVEVRQLGREGVSLEEVVIQMMEGDHVNV